MARATPGRVFSTRSPGRLRRWLLASGLALVGLASLPFLAAGALLALPAAALAPLVGALSSGQLRLALPVGQVTAGRGELWLRDAARREWQPWTPVDWRLAPRWTTGGPALQFDTNFAELRLDRSGLTVSRLRLQLPPELLMRALDHPLAKAPWRGDIELTAKRLNCPWAGLRRPTVACDGAARLQWQGMASSILPLPELGSFSAAIAAESRGDGRWRADLSTEHGVIAVSGYVELRNGVADYRIAIDGAAPLLADLDNVVGAGGYRRGGGGEFILQSSR